MKSLGTFIKLQKTYVDEQRIVLLKLQEQLQVIEDKIAALHAQRKSQEEFLHAMPDMGLTYGAYLAHYKAKLEELEKEKNMMERAVNMALDKLALLFEEQKRYEIAEEDRIKREAAEEADRERKTLDEVGSVSFARKQKSDRDQFT